MNLRAVRLFFQMLFYLLVSFQTGFILDKINYFAVILTVHVVFCTLVFVQAGFVWCLCAGALGTLIISAAEYVRAHMSACFRQLSQEIRDAQE